MESVRISVVAILVCCLGVSAEQDDCDLSDTASYGFELQTGYVFSANSSDDIIESVDGVLELQKCIELCKENDTCLSVNFETGLCVIMSTRAEDFPDDITPSHFPVFTIYAQKVCLKEQSKCEGMVWSYERIIDQKMIGHIKKTEKATSRFECIELCWKETEFTCRSANYDSKSEECQLSEMDRHTITNAVFLEDNEGYELLENNCVNDPTNMCEFTAIEGKVMKTVDAAFENVSSVEQCRDLCLNASFRCQNFDYGAIDDGICRISHHSTLSLKNVPDPFIELDDVTSFQIGSCFNISIECLKDKMVAEINTNQPFSGRVYTRGHSDTCQKEVQDEMAFQFELEYKGPDCGIRSQANDVYRAELIFLTQADENSIPETIALSVQCIYVEKNETVDEKELMTTTTESNIIPTGEQPNIKLDIVNKAGCAVTSASVGELLSLKFYIDDDKIPSDIYVRELVATDGKSNNGILLIDSLGCPVDKRIFGPVSKAEKNAWTTDFDAFKFEYSETVQFKALVTPCLSPCPAIRCNNGYSQWTYALPSSRDRLHYNHHNHQNQFGRHGYQHHDNHHGFRQSHQIQPQKSIYTTYHNQFRPMMSGGASFVSFRNRRSLDDEIEVTMVESKVTIQTEPSPAPLKSGSSVPLTFPCYVLLLAIYPLVLMS